MEPQWAVRLACTTKETHRIFIEIPLIVAGAMRALPVIRLGHAGAVLPPRAVMCGKQLLGVSNPQRLNLAAYPSVASDLPGPRSLRSLVSMPGGLRRGNVVPRATTVTLRLLASPPSCRALPTAAQQAGVTIAKTLRIIPQTPKSNPYTYVYGYTRFR